MHTTRSRGSGTPGPSILELVVTRERNRNCGAFKVAAGIPARGGTLRPDLDGDFQEDVWQQLVAEIDDTIQMFVDQRDTRSQLPNLKLRLAGLKAEQLKVQLWKLKYALQQDLDRLEERRRLAPCDQELCHLIALGTARWTDIWIKESLLERLTSHPDQQTVLAESDHLRKLWDIGSTETSDSA
jgi:hypothetical protein